MEDLLSEPLFFNDNINIANVHIDYKNWIAKGVFQIGQLVDDLGNFLSYEEFKLKYNVHVNFLNYMGCIKIVKKYFKSLDTECTNNKFGNTPCYLNSINAQKKGTKLFYKVLTNDNKLPNCCNRWEIIFNEKIDWKRCFSVIQQINDTKLKWFQLRIVHRILATNVILKEMGIMQSNVCGFCNQDRDSIVHCLWDCTYVQSFWNDVNNFFQTNCVNAHYLTFSKHLILFGFDKTSRCEKTFDFILLFAKFFIYQMKFENTTPNLLSFRRRLKRRYDIELYNQKLKMNSVAFKTAWACYMPLISFPNT